jgi:hypothetical protein
VRHIVSRGLSERRALQVIGMSASALRYQPAPDRNQALRQRIVTLAQRHRRYGAGMIYLKLRQEGLPAPNSARNLQGPQVDPVPSRPRGAQPESKVAS